jgi:hypothetical protein
MLSGPSTCHRYCRSPISQLWGLFRPATIAKPRTDCFLLFHAKLSAFDFFQRLKRGLGGLGGPWHRYESAAPTVSYGNERGAA